MKRKPTELPRSVSFTVPGTSPSGNNYVRHTREGRHYVTSEAKIFRSAVCFCSYGQRIRFKKYAVQIDVYLAAGQKGDLDNFAKVVLDSLTKGGIIDSDAKVCRLWMTKHRDKENPRTEITIIALDDL